MLDVFKTTVNWCVDNSILIGMGVGGVVTLIGGLRYAAAGDNPRAKQLAMKTIITGVIGFLLIAFTPKIWEIIYDTATKAGAGGDLPLP